MIRAFVLDDTTRILIMQRQIDFRNSDALRTAIAAEICLASGSVIVLDISRVQALSSLGIALLLSMRKLAIRTGRQLRLRGVTDRVHEKLRLLKLIGLFRDEIHSAQDVATAHA